jgi:hypothetical protein
MTSAERNLLLAVAAQLAVERPDPQITSKQMTDNQRHVRRLAETPGFRACDLPALIRRVTLENGA